MLFGFLIPNQRLLRCFIPFMIAGLLLEVATVFLLVKNGKTDVMLVPQNINIIVLILVIFGI